MGARRSPATNVSNEATDAFDNAHGKQVGVCNNSLRLSGYARHELQGFHPKGNEYNIAA